MTDITVGRKPIPLRLNCIRIVTDGQGWENIEEHLEEGQQEQALGVYAERIVAVAKLQEIIEKQTLVGNPSTFAIGYAFIGNDRTTEISMLAGGVNLLGFTKEGCHFTTRWMYLEGLVAWLKSFVTTMKADPYPIVVDGEFAAERHARAYDLAPEEEDAFWEYIFPLHDWGYNHSWHSESGGAILANIMFEYTDSMVELSWDNRHSDEGVVFDCEFGGTRIDAEAFKTVVLEFVDAYEKHWGIKVDDESTWLRRP